MTDDKTLVDAVKILKDANISKQSGSEHNEEVIGGVLTRLHNSELASDGQNQSKHRAEESGEGMKQAFRELRDNENRGGLNHV